jgi:hypothetical protein
MIHLIPESTRMTSADDRDYLPFVKTILRAICRRAPPERADLEISNQIAPSGGAESAHRAGAG